MHLLLSNLKINVCTLTFEGATKEEIKEALLGKMKADGFDLSNPALMMQKAMGMIKNFLPGLLGQGMGQEMLQMPEMPPMQEMPQQPMMMMPPRPHMMRPGHHQEMSKYISRSRVQ